MLLGVENIAVRNGILRSVERNVAVPEIGVGSLGRAPAHHVHCLKRGAFAPPLRHAVDNAGAFVAGELEADEPFFVEQARGLFQQSNPAAVVLDQVVVGGEDGGDLLLNSLRRANNRKALEVASANAFHIYSRDNRTNSTAALWRPEVVIE